MLPATVKSKRGRGLLEVFALTLESSLERAHIAGPQPTGDGELRSGSEHAGDVHRDECIQGRRGG